MKLVEKDNDKAEPVHMGWDAGQDALAAGTHVLVAPEGERIADQPSAQSPKPGTEPFDKDRVDNSSEAMPNMARQVIPAAAPSTPAPKTDAPKTAPAPAPAPAKSA